MAILFHSIDAHVPAIPKRQVSQWIKHVANQNHSTVGEISLIFCSDDYLLKINKQYLNHDYYTDVITFAYREGNHISGDIFISLDTVKSNAIQFNTTFDDELRRVIIHGILHLCGVNDKTPEEQTKMTQCENEALEYWKNGAY
ncbi:MAG: rRNA maturation RNase YbeY [Bacteroidales bacterium]|jgi:rRNA maturation RNase YbeY|nr:rRNA maturation RNase YbeY [Bacteroidales bacterium]